MVLIEYISVKRLIITNLLVFVKFERVMIIERTQIGKAIKTTKEGFK